MSEELSAIVEGIGSVAPGTLCAVLFSLPTRLGMQRVEHTFHKQVAGMVYLPYEERLSRLTLHSIKA